MSTLRPPSRFSLVITGSDDSLQVLAFKGKEAISQPFSFAIQLVSDRANLDLEALLHQPAFLAFNAQNGIHGQIERITRSGSDTRLTHYSLTLVPSLAYLAHRTQHRIFQHLTVQQIIEQVLEEHGIFSDGYTFAGFSDYSPREYCVQYGESDLHFIQRLCFEEGFTTTFAIRLTAISWYLAINSRHLHPLDGRRLTCPVAGWWQRSLRSLSLR